MPEIKNLASETEVGSRARIRELFENSPIPVDERITQLFLYMRRQDIARLLMLNELYEKILSVQGNVLDLGTRWGRNMGILQTLHAIYEPYNHGRKIVGFDTFKGFTGIDAKDGHDSIIKENSYSVTPEYRKHLEEVLKAQEAQNPISHISQFQIYEGDASETIYKYFDDNPESTVALAYFDFDLYKPTKACLEAIKGRMTKGSILIFDEINTPNCPGETMALSEVFGFDKYAIKRSKFGSVQAYIVIE